MFRSSSTPIHGMIFGSAPSSIPRACPLRKPMLYLCCTIQVTSCSGSRARSYGSQLNLPGIPIFTRILLASGLFENLTLRSGFIMRIRTQLTAFRIQHTVEACRGRVYLQ